jgi:PPK2 family polyphosphate:nucleotide phosphotransferase
LSYRKQFEVAPGSRVNLEAMDSGFTGKHKNKASALAEMKRDDRRLSDLQYLLYAEHKRSLLIVLQGPDAAGKDGTVRHVFGVLNPQGARVHAFKVPSQEEADHDFLWRAHIHAPAKGEIEIFNRSHYEDVLVPRVHGLIGEAVWTKRYEMINAFEENLALAGTTILKFYLHIDEKTQLKRFKKRLEDPRRQWKISEADYAERRFFTEYLEANDDAISRTSTPYAPWFVIPAKHKWFRNLAVSRIVVEALKSLNMQYPPPSVDIDDIRRKYHSAQEKERR